MKYFLLSVGIFISTVSFAGSNQYHYMVTNNNNLPNASNFILKASPLDTCTASITSATSWPGSGWWKLHDEEDIQNCPKFNAYANFSLVDSKNNDQLCANFTLAAYVYTVAPYILYVDGNLKGPCGINITVTTDATGFKVNISPSS